MVGAEEEKKTKKKKRHPPPARKRGDPSQARVNVKGFPAGPKGTASERLDNRFEKKGKSKALGGRPKKKVKLEKKEPSKGGPSEGNGLLRQGKKKKISSA